MNTTPPTTPPAGDRIAKVLARSGLASRRDAERLIAEGRVRVNGKVIDSPALNISATDRVSVDGKLIAEPEPPRLWLYHKPAGLVTSEKDEKDRQTVFDTLPADMPRVMSVGRLDLNSEGLLILTNDGEVKRKLELPSTGWLRRYRVRINGSVSEERLENLRKGITVEGVEYQPMGVTFDRQQGANAWLTVTLREGKNREIRRTMEAIGVTVNRLIRISYGPFQLGNLKPGEVEELKQRVVRDQLGLDTRPLPQRGRKAAAEDAAPAKPSRKHIKGDSAAAMPARNMAKPGTKATAKPAYLRARPTEAPDRPEVAPSGHKTPLRVMKQATYAKDGDASGARPAAKPAARGPDGKPIPRSAGRLSHGGTADKPARASGFKSHKSRSATPETGSDAATAGADKPRRPAKTRATPSRHLVPGARPDGPPRKGPARGKKPKG